MLLDRRQYLRRIGEHVVVSAKDTKFTCAPILCYRCHTDCIRFNSSSEILFVVGEPSPTQTPMVSIQAQQTIGFTTSASRDAFLGSASAKAAATQAFANTTGVDINHVSGTYVAATSRRLEQTKLRSLQTNSFGIVATYTVQNVNPSNAQSLRNTLSSVPTQTFTQAFQSAMTNAGLGQFATASVTAVTVITTTTTTTTTANIQKKSSGRMASTVSLATFFVGAMGFCTLWL